MSRYVRSAIYVAQIYLAMAILGVCCAPWAAVSVRGARLACKAWCRWALWTAGWMIGLRVERRGTVPQSAALITAKHQSFLDVMLLFEALPNAAFVMKREILWVPIIGLYARRIGCIAIARDQGAAALRAMLADAAVVAGTPPTQLIVYPQGTRVAPGAQAPYKPGVAALYARLGQTCIPVATNAGVFWPRKGIMRRAGRAAVAFLPPIPPGLDRAAFMTRLEAMIETHSQALLEEAGSSGGVASGLPPTRPF